jgi:hypothetical protein
MPLFYLNSSILSRDNLKNRQNLFIKIKLFIKMINEGKIKNQNCQEMLVVILGNPFNFGM